MISIDVRFFILLFYHLPDVDLSKISKFLTATSISSIDVYVCVWFRIHYSLLIRMELPIWQVAWN